jgi:hypothetical protein
MKKKFVVDMKVSSKIAKEVFYSNYGGKPFKEFVPGMVGIINAVDVPPVKCVRGHNPNKCNCKRIIVDFGTKNKYGSYSERVSFYSDELVEVDQNLPLSE